MKEPEVLISPTSAGEIMGHIACSGPEIMGHMAGEVQLKDPALEKMLLGFVGSSLLGLNYY